MADATASFKAGGAPVGSAPITGSEVPRGSSPNRATSVSDLLQLMSSPTKLSKEGEGYMATIVDALTKSGREPKVTAIVGSSYEARILEYNECITAFVFAETYVPGDPAYPPAWVVKDLRNRFVSNGVKGEPSLFLVVTKEDYDKADIMATLIVNAYKCNDTPALKNFTAANLTDSSYGLTDDMTFIRPFVERNCPFATLPRMDVGVMLYINEQVQNDLNPAGGRPEYQRTPVVAVTGYTDFVYADEQNLNGITGSQVKFVPIFVITGIFSIIVDKSIATIGLSLAAYLMIGKSFWAKQFSTFKKDKPNIGNLLTNNETGAPIEVTNIQERNSVINSYLTTPFPYMALDLQLGNFVIPNLSKMIDNSAEFNLAVDQFTGGDGATKAGKPCQLVTVHFDGRIRQTKTGEYIDTRCIDYLSLVKQGYPQSDVASFLRVMQRPDIKSQEILKVNPDSEFLFITYRAFLNPYFVINVASDLEKVLQVRIDSVMELGSYNIGSLNGFQQAGIGNMGGFAIASSVGGFNSSWLW